ncbi:hypothetical protein SAMN04488697_10290 [Pseudomonas sp. 43mfcvi1.1]|jgi:hypothetical protein|uniref:DUF7683 domain-containing protein n=1 Tax=Pseudomonas TaxID=286 RepID=UPI000D6D40B9|nr:MULTISPECIES: hypothetical protein [Pseudomonas]MCD9118280.1 hypothetical protein [Pseudomonas bijieensis]PWJ40328.1 hypothetical protein ATJ40_10290 [Pseudomonas sp. 43mfcvi1.1]UQI31497.1 hypothetical protein M3M50_02425 [Pseudomonas bijieensis]SSB94993.1 hypothetical protein SAMN04488697_10290 [Pseudomonas sp. 43mfcvi1.1]
MIYIVEAFDKKTGFFAFEEKIPEGHDEDLKEIMGWTSEQQGWEGYDLTRSQLDALEVILGRNIYDPIYIFQLSCNDYA